jgi:Spy/CpxP family protein refolding chaperone
MKRFAIRQLAPAMALLFTLGVTLASAQEFRGEHRKMGGFGIMRGLSRLDLTELQKTEVKRIMESRRTTFESLRERVRADREALQSASEGQSPDTSVVGAAFLKLRADRQALRAERKATMEQIRSLLTSEQQQRLDGMIQERKQRLEERHGPRERFGR